MIQKNINISYIFFLKVDTILIVVNLTIFNFVTIKLKKKGILKMTASLANFLSSLVAGSIVVLGIGIALVIISKSDRVTRV